MVFPDLTTVFGNLFVYCIILVLKSWVFGVDSACVIAIFDESEYMVR